MSSRVGIQIVRKIFLGANLHVQATIKNVIYSILLGLLPWVCKIVENIMLQREPKLKQYLFHTLDQEPSRQ